MTATPPVLLTDKETLLFVFRVTLPKLALLGLLVSEPGASPVPESEILSGEPVASDTMASVPLAPPVAVGVKLALKVTLWFAARVTGSDSPLTEKPVPVTLACEMVTELPPVLVRVSDFVAVLPT